MTEQVEQQICIKFCIKLEHSSMETIRMIQKAAAMGNWWLAASSQQCAHSCLLSHAEGFFCETSNHSGDSAYPIAQIWYPVTSGFPKTKITFEREEISDHRWDSGRYDGAANGGWENCVRCQAASCEGDWGVIVLGTMFLVSPSANVSIFHVTWLDASWTDLVFPAGKRTVHKQ